MVRTTDVSKNFGEINAVNSISFAVGKGEIFGIVGPDGSGKSTLLRLLSTILRPDKGEIFIGELDARADSFMIKKGMAYMPQRFGLYEDLTVEENILFFGRIFGMRPREIRERIPMLYDFSSLGPFSGRLAGKLSGGMKQKLGLACCLVHKPDLLLLDEPTNGVDPVSRREFWKILYNLLAGGVTIIVSTSYLDEAERCNRIGLIYKGRFIRIGIPKEIKDGIKKKLLCFTVDRPIEGEMLIRSDGGMPGVIRSGNGLKLFIRDPRESSDKIGSILARGGIKVLSRKIIAPTLEDCFIEIISEEA